MADTILKVDNINVYYGNIHAVKGVSFTVNEGEIVTLIGANGAGKSTTLKTVSGLLKPRTGDVLYRGKSIKGVRAHKIVEAGLAQVPEGRHVFLHMTVDEPSMGLSPLLVQEIFDIIRNIHKEGMTILLVEQNAQMALSVADRAYVLETGCVVMDGTGAELLTNERVRSAYLGG